MYLCIDENIIDNANLKPQEVYLLLCLIKLADDNGKLVISAKDLMNISRFTNKAMLLRYLGGLESSGYIEKNINPGTKNSYKINKNIFKKDELK